MSVKLNKNICVVGAGYWGKNHINALFRLNALGGVVELDNNVLKKVISESTSGQYHAYHLRCLTAALQEMDSLNVNLNELELVAEKLKSVQNHISEILENKDDDRVLSGIFSNFCIGK